jgi:transposase, IS30 family
VFSAPFPKLLVGPITFDRGTEFTDWSYLQASLGVQTRFCDPQSPWQKGTVETPTDVPGDGFRETRTHY